MPIYSTSPNCAAGFVPPLRHFNSAPKEIARTSSKISEVSAKVIPSISSVVLPSTPAPPRPPRTPSPKNGSVISPLTSPPTIPRKEQAGSPPPRPARNGSTIGQSSALSPRNGSAISPLTSPPARPLRKNSPPKEDGALSPVRVVVLPDSSVTSSQQGSTQQPVVRTQSSPLGELSEKVASFSKSEGSAIISPISPRNGKTPIASSTPTSPKRQNDLTNPSPVSPSRSIGSPRSGISSPNSSPPKEGSPPPTSPRISPKPLGNGSNFKSSETEPKVSFDKGTKTSEETNTDLPLVQRLYFTCMEFHKIIDVALKNVTDLSITGPLNKCNKARDQLKKEVFPPLDTDPRTREALEKHITPETIDLSSISRYLVNVSHLIQKVPRDYSKPVFKKPLKKLVKEVTAEQNRLAALRPSKTPPNQRIINLKN